MTVNRVVYKGFKLSHGGPPPGSIDALVWYALNRVCDLPRDESFQQEVARVSSDSQMFLEGMLMQRGTRGKFGVEVKDRDIEFTVSIDGVDFFNDVEFNTWLNGRSILPFAEWVKSVRPLEVAGG